MKKVINKINDNYKYIMYFLILLLISMIGITYSWFSTSITGQGSKTATFVTDQLKLIYTDSLAVNASSIVPGWTSTKTFTVQNISNQKLKYKIVWDNLINTFVTNYLKITVTSTNGGGSLTKSAIQKSATAGDYDLITNIFIPANTTQTYTVTFEYENTEADQTADMNKKFSGSIGISALDNQAGTLLSSAILSDNPNVKTRTSFNGAFTTSNNGNTIYSASGQGGATTYYFAGAVTNNYVYFANKYWRIVRINEDGGIRLIYAGTSATDTAAFVKTSQKFNSASNKSIYVGYKYTSGSQYGLGTNSLIKTYLDEWYTSNLNSSSTIDTKGNKYDKYISRTAIYCNDRTVGNGTWVETGTEFKYAAYTRLLTNKSPILTCNQLDDRFTASSTTGNNQLYNSSGVASPIALITADEVSYAGGRYGADNTSYYIYQNASSGATYWLTMSPYYWSGSSANMWGVGATSDPGRLRGNTSSAAGRAVRPVISLKSCVQWSGGIGTSERPYLVKIDSSCASAIN